MFNGPTSAKRLLAVAVLAGCSRCLPPRVLPRWGSTSGGPAGYERLRPPGHGRTSPAGGAPGER